MHKRITILGCAVMFIFFLLIVKIYTIAMNPEYYSIAVEQGSYTLKVGHTYGSIYDRNFNLLVNDTTAYYVAVNPTPEAMEKLLPYIKDKDEYYAQMVYGKPFVCEVTKKGFDCRDITEFEIPVRNRETQLAQHIIGYTNENGGVTGIEYAYEKVLHEQIGENSVTYNVDGYGNVMEGLEKNVVTANSVTNGVVLTIDKYIQAICELAGSKLEKGAIVVMDIHSGDILGMASFPSYTMASLSQAVNDENSPLINRCLYSYNVGSIFKLVTSLAAFEQGFDENFSYNCTGITEVSNQKFKCHDLSGHGMIDMYEAMRESCNTYFIELSRHIDSEIMLEISERLGFGRSISLANKITVSGGTLQTEDDLFLPAEKANMSFGQGKLTASPVQICAFTSAIANEGTLYVPRLVRGISRDGERIVNENTVKCTEVFDRKTSFRLQDLMIEAVDRNENSNARPSNAHVAGKTSTAQTGRFDENGEEVCHGWITGYFPLSCPKYAVTVLCEDGGYGNECAAPVFREIVQRITDIYGKTK